MIGECPCFVKSVRGVALLLSMLGASQVLEAQVVYRCEIEGKPSYSHEPCLGARAVDTTPTQGLDRSSGVSRKGADVRRDERDRQMGEALRPLTGMSPEQRKTQHRRFRLSAGAQLECKTLDARLISEAAAERAATDPRQRLDAQTALFEGRKRYRKLGC